jgi:hypothetical protein
MRMKLAAVAAALLLQTCVSQERTERPAPVAVHSRAEMSQALDQTQADLSALTQHHENYRQAAEKISTMYSDLGKKAAEVARLAQGVKSGQPVGSAQTGSAQAALMNAVQQMQEMQMSFNLQYLGLQNQMQNENRQFSMVSNIMKTRQDTVKNAIGNIK